VSFKQNKNREFKKLFASYRVGEAGKKEDFRHTRRITTTTRSGEVKRKEKREKRGHSGPSHQDSEKRKIERELAVTPRDKVNSF